MESLTKQEAALIRAELQLDVESPTTQALIKLGRLYNELACVYAIKFSDSRFIPTQIDLNK